MRVPSLEPTRGIRKRLMAVCRLTLTRSQAEVCSGSGADRIVSGQSLAVVRRERTSAGEFNISEKHQNPGEAGVLCFLQSDRASIHDCEVCARPREKSESPHHGRYAREFLSSFVIGNTAPRIVPALTRWPSPAPWPTRRATSPPCRR